jgi:hypothetical protein
MCAVNGVLLRPFSGAVFSLQYHYVALDIPTTIFQYPDLTRPAGSLMIEQTIHNDSAHFAKAATCQKTPVNQGEST